MRSTAGMIGSIAVVLMAWIAVWGLADTVTETRTREERQRLYWGILLTVALVIAFNPKLLHRF